MRPVTRIARRAAPALLAWLFSFPAFAGGVRTIELTTIDPDATGYGTFQSHNQKVLANKAGIFATSLHRHTSAYEPANWRLSRSTDGGRTFTVIFESDNPTKAPSIETDDESNIYLAHT